MSLILSAANLARKAHEGQKRKYTGRQYIEHPARVAGKIGLYVNVTEEMVAAAYLHDVLEDTQATFEDIVAATSQPTAELVKWVTNPSKQHPNLKREERKAMDREHLRWAPWEAKIIKMVDRIDNLLDMEGAAWDFRALYAQESIMLADAVGDVDSYLKKDLVDIAQKMKEKAALP